MQENKQEVTKDISSKKRLVKGAGEGEGEENQGAQSP